MPITYALIIPLNIKLVQIEFDQILGFDMNIHQITADSKIIITLKVYNIFVVAVEK